MKTKSNYFLLFCLMVGFCVFSCTIEFVDSDVETPSSLSFLAPCSITFKGEIKESNTTGSIDGAVIESEDFDFSIASGNEGEYLINVLINEGTIDASPKIIEVSKEGFIPSKLEINLNDYYLNNNDCEEDGIYIDVDFVLTPQHDCQEIFSTSASSYLIDSEYPISLASATYDPNLDFTEEAEIKNQVFMRVNVPTHAVDSRSDLCITPINPDQYFGLLEPTLGDATYEMGLQRFDIQLNGEYGAMFNVPIGIQFSPVDFVVQPGDELRYYILDMETNRWSLDTDATFETDPQSGAITVNFRHVQPGMITNASVPFTLLSNEILPDDPILPPSAFANCDCLDPFDYDYGILFEQVDEELILQGGMEFNETLAKLQTMKVLLNITASTSLENVNFLGTSDSQIPGFSSLRIFDDQEIRHTNEVDKCSVQIEDVIPNFRRIQGRFGNALFTYNSYAGVIVRTSVQDCPTTTLCHQGCPE